MKTEVSKKQREAYRILIAEDNQVNMKMMVVMLQDAGYRTASVSNGEEAVKFITDEKPDLVLMDIHMPDMDGFTATAEIRRLPVPLNSTPVVAITAQGLTGDKEKCLEAGMNDYISKPVTPQLLVQKLDSVLGINETGNETPQKIQLAGKILDEEYLDKISLGSREFLQDLLLTYAEDMETRLRNLEKAFKTKDTKTIILESHSIKGASLSLGLSAVAEEAMAIEISGKCDDLAAAESRFPALTDSFKEAKKEILDFVE